LGARHAAAAAVTARTAATGVVVSATDGNVRVFSAGRMVLRMDPDIEHGPIHMGE
jgi:diadenylate cyclase